MTEQAPHARGLVAAAAVTLATPAAKRLGGHARPGGNTAHVTAHL